LNNAEKIEVKITLVVEINRGILSDLLESKYLDKYIDNSGGNNW